MVTSFIEQSDKDSLSLSVMREPNVHYIALRIMVY